MQDGATLTDMGKEDDELRAYAEVVARQQDDWVKDALAHPGRVRFPPAHRQALAQCDDRLAEIVAKASQLAGIVRLIYALHKASRRND